MAKRLDAAIAVSTALGASSSRTVCYIVPPTYIGLHMTEGYRKGGTVTERTFLGHNGGAAPSLMSCLAL